MSESNESSLMRRVMSGAVIATGLAGLALGINQVADDSPSNLTELEASISDIGVTPMLDVSSTGTEALITANDFIRDNGWKALGAGALVYGGLRVARRRNDSLDGTFEYIEIGERSRAMRNKASKVLPAAIIASVAVASGIGDAAGDSANQPMAFLQDTLGASPSTPVIVQHGDVIPFNHSEVMSEDIKNIRISVSGDSTQIVPFELMLGNVTDPSAQSNPSSAPIVALPELYLQNAFNADFSSLRDDCEDLPVVVGSQLGAENGDIIRVEGRTARVVDTIETFPGLDRVAVITSLEKAEECLSNDEAQWGAVVLGTDLDKDELQKKIEEMGMDYVVEDFSSLNEKYKDFWDRSVKPPMMQLVLLAFGAGSAGLIYIRSSEVLQRKKQIANLVAAGGVPKETISHAEDLKSLLSGLRATGYAAVPAVALTAMTNSSQYGMELATSVESMGAGFLTYLGVSYIGARGAKKVIKGLDVAAEMRTES